jgi:hypothetical protein
MNTVRNAKAQRVRTEGLSENQNFIVGGKPKGFDVLNYRKNASLGQCQRCGSDYMKFSVKGFCQDCQQRCEFIMREHPHIASEIKNQQRGARYE